VPALPAKATKWPVVRVESRVPGEPVPNRTAAVRLTAWVEGRVQGVGFRWWVRANALELKLAGYAENLPDGRVTVVAEGDRKGCQELLRRLEDGDATSWHRRPGKVSRVTHRWAQAEGGISGFRER
jgi:acylphosphatase